MEPKKQEVIIGYPSSNYKNNVLLIKPEVGKTKQTIYKLPSLNHIYGKAPIKDKEPLKNVLTQWKYPEHSRAQLKKIDYICTNKQLIADKCINIKNQQEQRKNYSFYQKQHEGSKCIEIVLPENNFTYGIKNKPPTPMNEVIQFGYGQRSAEQLQQFYQQRQLEIQQRKLQKSVNKSMQLKSQVVKIQQVKRESKQYEQLKNDFKLKKYLNIKSKLQSYLSQQTLPKVSYTQVELQKKLPKNQINKTQQNIQNTIL